MSAADRFRLMTDAEKYAPSIDVKTLEPLLGLLQAARLYYHRCEVFDRKACSGWDMEARCAVPINDQQRAQISRNATKVAEELREEFWCDAIHFSRAMKAYQDGFAKADRELGLVL